MTVTEWSARVDLAGAADLEQGGTLVDELADYFAAVGVDQAVGVTSISLSVSAGTVRQAADAALAAVRAAAHTAGVPPSVVGLEIITPQELDRRNREPAIPQLVSATEGGITLGVSRQRFEQLADQDPDFPPAVARVGPTGRRLWLQRHVERYAQRARRPGRRPRRSPTSITSAEPKELAP